MDELTQQIVQLTPSDPRLDAAVAVILAGFGDNPTTARYLPDPDRRHRYLRHLTLAGVRDVARHGRVWAATSSPAPAGRAAIAGSAAIVGVLMALPPGGFPASLRRRLQALPQVGRAALVARRAYLILRSAAVDLRCTLPPTRDWWYLHSIAVHPEVRRAGIGTLLLRHALRAVDETGAASYLHTQGVELARRWQRFGFATVGSPKERAGEAPYYTMVRQPVGHHG